MKGNYAFIDSQNVHVGVLAQGWILDWKIFHTYLREKYNVTHAFMFLGYMKENERLYTKLRNAGYTLIFRPVTQYWENGKLLSKGNIDADLVLHTMIEYPNYDQAVIVSGDGDFYSLINYLLQKHKLHRLIVPNSNRYSSLLRVFARETTYLDRLYGKM